MLNNISWTSYCYVLIQLLLIYYTAILWLYYRKDLSLYIKNKYSQGKQQVALATPAAKEPSEQQTSNGNQFTTAYLPFAPSTGDKRGQKINAMVQGLIDEIKAYLKQAAKGGASREELLYSLHQILQKYPALKNSAFQSSITDLMVSELQNLCSTYLDSEDANALWER